MTKCLKGWVVPTVQPGPMVPTEREQPGVLPGGWQYGQKMNSTGDAYCNDGRGPTTASKARSRGHHAAAVSVGVEIMGQPQDHSPRVQIVGTGWGKIHVRVRRQGGKGGAIGTGETHSARRGAGGRSTIKWGSSVTRASRE